MGAVSRAPLDEWVAVACHDRLSTRQAVDDDAIVMQAGPIGYKELMVNARTSNRFDQLNLGKPATHR
jgi:hypothetical protein